MKRFGVAVLFAVALLLTIAILELDPASPWAHVNYSSFLGTQARHDEAIDQGKQALALMDFGMGHQVLAKAYYGRGVHRYWDTKEPAEARADFAGCDSC